MQKQFLVLQLYSKTELSSKSYVMQSFVLVAKRPQATFRQVNGENKSARKLLRKSGQIGSKRQNVVLSDKR